jgi:hypothetical protein
MDARGWSLDRGGLQDGWTQLFIKRMDQIYGARQTTGQNVSSIRRPDAFASTNAARVCNSRLPRPSLDATTKNVYWNDRGLKACAALGKSHLLASGLRSDLLPTSPRLE